MQSLPKPRAARKAGAIAVRTNLSAELCPRCGGTAEAHREPPSSIHFARLTCQDCRRFIRWVPFAGLGKADQECLNLFKAAVSARARGRVGDLPRLFKALAIRGWDVRPISPARRWGGPAR